MPAVSIPECFSRVAVPQLLGQMQILPLRDLVRKPGRILRSDRREDADCEIPGRPQEQGSRKPERKSRTTTLLLRDDFVLDLSVCGLRNHLFAEKLRLVLVRPVFDDRRGVSVLNARQRFQLGGTRTIDIDQCAVCRTLYPCSGLAPPKPQFPRTETERSFSRSSSLIPHHNNHIDISVNTRIQTDVFSITPQIAAAEY